MARHLRRLPFHLPLTLILLAAAASVLHAGTGHEGDDHDHDHGEGTGPNRCFTFSQADTTADLASGKQGAGLLACALCGGRPVMPLSLQSEHFYIHYWGSGNEAPPLADRNANGHPDYIDSVAFYLEMAWRVEIDSMGYKAPGPDNRNPGRGGPDGRIDVYICNLARGYYGGACPESDNPVGDGYASYLVMDNDYQGGYPSPGILGVRVTAAHEFHHVVQFGYKVDFSQRSIFEATAVWMERQLHPEIDDYLQYVDSFLHSPQNYPISTNSVDDGITGYAHVLYLEYLSKKYGRDVIREIWEEFRGTDEFKAIDNVLRRRSFNLENSYCEFAEWCYYTGSRARDTTYLPNAENLPTMRPADTRHMSDGNVLFEDALYPLSFGLYRLTVPTANINVRDTVDFVVTNARSDINGGGSNIQREAFALEADESARPDFTEIPLAAGSVYYRLDAPNQQFCLFRSVNGSVQRAIAVRTSPQPFINDGGNSLIFAVPETTELIRKIRVWIYSSGMTRVRELEQKELIGANNLLGVVWDGLDHEGRPAPSGIYIYEMSINDGDPSLGKFAVVGK